MEDRLTEISIEDLKRLRDLYTPDGIKSYTAFVTIDNYLRWNEQDPKTKNENIKFLCLNGDISGGTFVVIECNIVCADTLHKSIDELYRLLLLLDYSTEYFFFSYSDHVAEVIRNAVKEKTVKIGLDDSILFYYLPKEKALEFDIHHVDEIDLKPLTILSDIEKIYSLWPIDDRNPFEFLLNATKYNPSVAVFTKDGTPVAWIFRHLSGLFMSLQTHKNYQKHGFGSLVTKALAKRVAELGHDSYTTIFDDNIASQSLFEKIGFQAKGRVYLLRTKVNKDEDNHH